MTLCVSLYRFLFGGLGLWRAGREVHFVDGTRRAFGGALAAHFALFKVDVSHIVLNRDGVKCAYLCALAAADAGSRAGFAGHSALVFVHARHKQAAGTRFLMSEITMFEQISTKVVANPILIPLMADDVVPSVGHIPSSRTNVGFSLIRPFSSIFRLLFIVIALRCLSGAAVGVGLFLIVGGRVGVVSRGYLIVGLLIAFPIRCLRPRFLN